MQTKTFVVAFLVAAATAAVVQGSYVITTPRRWILGESSKVCVFHVGQVAQNGDHLRVTLRDDQNNAIIAPTTLPIEPGQTNRCYQILLPKDSRTSPFVNTITFEGKLGKDTLHQYRRLSLAEAQEKTFLQTDKFLYRPGQLVRLRILTVRGKDALPSVENYPAVYVETPSGTRIQQWLDVDNSRGLVHLEFQLNQEVEEGTYKVVVQTPKGEGARKTFRVEDYVPPKFEVTVTVPKVILRTDDRGSVKVCAKYTFGQPVKGNATVVFTLTWPHNITKHNIISGCQDFEFNFREVDAFPLSGLVNVEATVEEEGTGLALRSSEKISIGDRETYDYKTIHRKLVAKPGLPLLVRVRVTRKREARAAAHVPLKACLRQILRNDICKKFTTDSKGILSFQVPYGALDLVYRKWLHITSLDGLEVSEDDFTFRWPDKSFKIETFFSPSNSSLFLRVPLEEELECRGGRQHHMHLDLLFSAFRQRSANITVQVISRGEIAYQHTAEYILSSSPLSLNLEYFAPMAQPVEGVVVGSVKIPVSLQEPEAKVLVWYSRDDGEVVSDMAELNFGDCLDNPVDMAWDATQAEPGHPATLTLTAEPTSLCSLGVVDKSVELLSRTENPLTVKQILDLVRKSNQFDKIFRHKYDHYCSRNEWDVNMGSGPRSSGGAFLFPYRTDHKDALSVFDDSGIFFITDLTTEARPCQPVPSGPGSTVNRFGGVPSVVSSAGGAGFGIGSSFASEVGSRGPPGIDAGIATVAGTAQEEELDSPRSYFPETWLWDFDVIPETGRSLRQFTLPDTVTEWVGHAVCVHPQRGVGLSGESSITTFTPFFAKLTLPPSVKRGEILPVKISVFNYLDQGLPVKVVLASSPEYDILDGEGKGQAVATVAATAGVRSACVASNEKVTHSIRIKPKVIGNVNLTVDAAVDPSIPHPCGSPRIRKRDSLIQPLRVEAEGFPREETWSKYICTQDLTHNEDSLGVWYLEPPAGTVEGSERAFVSANGELLGPSLDNLEHLIRMPSGCGEQNMVLFTPNIYALQYFEATNQVRDPIVERSKRYMENGYQRELTFRHYDGSYSAFGRRDPSGSTWLTAFVVKSFAQARQYVFIDEDDLTVSIDWLKSQQVGSGCFRSVGKVIHKSMKGGLSGTSSEAPLTAYVLMALLEAGESPATSSVRSATACLLQQENNWTTYTRAITSYALALAGHTEATRVLRQLLQEATKSPTSISWENPTGKDTGKVKGKDTGVAVETAGYAVLAMTTLDRANFQKEALRVVKWISSKRNGQGGFVSTQDTVVALQALAAYSPAVYEDISVAVNLRAQNLQHTFTIDERNRAVHQFVMLPTLPTEVDLDISGKGCVFLQAVLRYNVPDPDPTEAFSLRVDIQAVPDRRCTTRRIEACATYLLPDLTSNMAILEVNLVSGYVPVKEDLKRVVSESPLFKRFEVDRNTVLFYIDELSSQELCASFKVKRELEVENAKPGTVRVYDYYQPELVLEKSYVLPSASQC